MMSGLEQFSPVLSETTGTASRRAAARPFGMRCRYPVICTRGGISRQSQTGRPAPSPRLAQVTIPLDRFWKSLWRSAPRRFIADDARASLCAGAARAS